MKIEILYTEDFISIRAHVFDTSENTDEIYTRRINQVTGEISWAKVEISDPRHRDLLRKKSFKFESETLMNQFLDEFLDWYILLKGN